MLDGGCHKGQEYYALRRSSTRRSTADASKGKKIMLEGGVTLNARRRMPQRAKKITLEGEVTPEGGL